jgi:hypothetical protein
MQCACVKLSSVASPALQYASALSHERHYFRQQVNEYVKCVSIFLSEIFLILRGAERDIIKNAFCLRVKYPLFLSDFNKTVIFLIDN